MNIAAQIRAKARQIHLKVPEAIINQIVAQVENSAAAQVG